MRYTSLLNEADVLKALGITDFRHLSKEKVMTFASMLPVMDPETAKAALAQFPEYAKSVIGIVNEYSKVVAQGMKSNDDSQKQYYELTKLIIDSIREQLNKESCTAEERRYMFDMLLEVEKRINEKDSENKKHTTVVIGTVGTVVVIAIVALASVLGGSSSIHFPTGKAA